MRKQHDARRSLGSNGRFPARTWIRDLECNTPVRPIRPPGVCHSKLGLRRDREVYYLPADGPLAELITLGAMSDRAFLLCLALQLVACGDKKTPPSAASITLPAVPLGSGITLRIDDAATVVTDTIAKYELRVPGALSKIESQPSTRGTHPNVVLYHDLKRGFEMVAISPMRPDQAPTDPSTLAAFYSGVAASIKDGTIDGATAKDLVATDVTIAGHPARRFDARLDAGQHQGHLCQVVVAIPDKLVVYSFSVVDGEAAAITDPVALYSSLHALP